MRSLINITEPHLCFAGKTSPWLMNVCMNAWKSNFGLNIVRADLGTINFFCIPCTDNSSAADKIW